MSHDIETRKKALEARRTALIRRWFESLDGETELLADRPPDWEDLSAEQRDAALLDVLGNMERRQLEAIRAALARIEAGTYGSCAGCGEPIDDGRLAAMPEVALCIGCQGLAEDARAPLRGGPERFR